VQKPQTTQPHAGSPFHRLRNVYYGWWLAAAGMGLGFLGALNNYGFGVFFLPITKELGLSRAQTSLVFSAARLEGGLEAPIAGWLTDRLGPRVMLLVGNTLTGVGFILLGTQVQSFWSLFIIWVFITSVGFQTGFFTGVMTAMNSWFIRHRAKAISIVSSSNRIGGFIWTPVLGLIVVSQGWHTGAVIAGIIVLVVGTPLSLLFRRSPESIGLQPDGDSVQQSNAARQPTGARSSSEDTVDFTVGEAMRTPSFWILASAQFCRMLSFGAISVHLIPMLVWKGETQLGAAFMASLYPLVGIPMTLVFGFLGDRYGPKKLLAASTMLSALSLVLLAFATSLPLLYLFVFLYGIAESAGSLNLVMTGHFFGRKSFATLRGIMGAITVLGPFTAPIYAGWVFDRTESYFWALVPFFLFKALAGPLYLLVPKPKPPKRTLPSAPQMAQPGPA